MPEDVSVDFSAKGSGEILKVLQQIEKLLQSIDKSSAAMAAAFNKAAAASKTVTAAANQQAKAVNKAQQAQQGMAQSLDAVKQASEAYQESLKAQYPTLDAVIKRMSELRAQLAIIKRDGMEQSGVTQQQVNAMRAEVAALDQVAGGMRRAAKETKQADREQKKLTKTASNLFKRFVLVGAGARTMMAAILAVRTEVLEGVKAVYSQTEEYKRLDEAYQKARNSAVLFLGTIAGAEDTMNNTSDALENISDGIIATAAGFKALAAYVQSFQDIQTILLGIQAGTSAAFTKFLETGTWDQAEFGKAFTEFTIGALEAQGELEDFGTTFTETYNELNRQLDESIEREDKFSSALNSARSAVKRYNDELERHKEALAGIERQYGGAGGLGTEQIAAYERQRTTRMQIEYDLGKELEKIQAAYNKRRQQAIADAAKQRERAVKDANRDIKRMQEQHNLEMLYAQRRFELTRVQNERLYQFERGRLVAEGDVLAIEELDARHELEKQAAEENFKLQQEQAEAMFQLQLKYQKQAAQEMAQAIQRALDEQLAALAQQQREEEEAARTAAEEDLMQNDIDFQNEMTQLRQQKEERLAAEEEAHQERLDELAEYWGEYLAENRIGLEEGLAMWNSMMGLNGELDTLIQGAYTRELQFTANFATEWERHMGQVSASTRQMVNEVTALLAQLAVQQQRLSNLGGGYGSGGYGGGRRGASPGVYPFQHGGEFIATQPKLIKVGERGLPEKVSIQPLSPIGVGGTLGVKWTGGAIPVEGRGNLSGADLQQWGDNIAAGLMQSLTLSFSRRHGIRGR